ncbi:unnamed protein product [Lasius platythorax]|uniref:Uncharacterized protein n=1 Tax=Lasius platythorax TaxID=488582 RepID=A0AAV2NN41_9HYME
MRCDDGAPSEHRSCTYKAMSASKGVAIIYRERANTHLNSNTALAIILGLKTPEEESGQRIRTVGGTEIKRRSHATTDCSRHTAGESNGEL